MLCGSRNWSARLDLRKREERCTLDLVLRVSPGICGAFESVTETVVWRAERRSFELEASGSSRREGTCRGEMRRMREAKGGACR